METHTRIAFPDVWGGELGLTLGEDNELEIDIADNVGGAIPVVHFPLDDPAHLTTVRHLYATLGTVLDMTERPR